MPATTCPERALLLLRPPPPPPLLHPYAASLALLPLLVSLSPLTLLCTSPSRSTPILFPPLPSFPLGPLNPLILSGHSLSLCFSFCFFLFISLISDPSIYPPSRYFRVLLLFYFCNFEKIVFALGYLDFSVSFGLTLSSTLLSNRFRF